MYTPHYTPGGGTIAQYPLRNHFFITYSPTLLLTWWSCCAHVRIKENCYETLFYADSFAAVLVVAATPRLAL